MIIPIVPLLSKNFGATALQSGLLMSVYSLMQFVFAPFWGKLSDRSGRRKILLFCLLGEALSYLLFAYARDLNLLFAARIMAGFFAASISTASAYISDVTDIKNRSKNMGLIGAAFGLGFLIGPAVGGLLISVGQNFSTDPHFGTSFAALCVAGLFIATLIFAYFKLDESLKPENQSTPKKDNFIIRLKNISSAIHRPIVGPLMGVYFISSFSMAMMEATLILYMADLYQWTVREVSYGFAFIGLIAVFNQGFLVRKILPKVGESRLILSGLVLMTVSFALTADGSSLTILAVAMTLLAFGNGFVNASTLGSISVLAKENEQGFILGSTQSMASLGRIIGPALGGFLYVYGKSYPFVASSITAFVGAVVMFRLYPKLPKVAMHSKDGEGVETDTSSIPTGNLNEINQFQFNNLVQNRIPMAVVPVNLALADFFKDPPLKHLIQYQINTGIQEDNQEPVPAPVIIDADVVEVIQGFFDRSRLPKHYAILMISKDRKRSLVTVDELEKLGFMNVYFYPVA